MKTNKPKEVSALQVTPKAARVNKGLTQADVAQYMGVSVDVIKRIEAGKRPLKVTEMEKLCELYECSFDDISLPTNIA